MTDFFVAGLGVRESMQVVDYDRSRPKDARGVTYILLGALLIIKELSLSLGALRVCWRSSKDAKYTEGCQENECEPLALFEED
jgi:hypothetical protein